MEHYRRDGKWLGDNYCGRAVSGSPRQWLGHWSNRQVYVSVHMSHSVTQNEYKKCFYVERFVVEIQDRPVMSEVRVFYRDAYVCVAGTLVVCPHSGSCENTLIH